MGRNNRKRKLNEFIDNEDKIKCIVIDDFKPSIYEPKCIKDLIKIGEEWNSYRDKLEKDKEYITKNKKLRKRYYRVLEKNIDYKRVAQIVKHLRKLQKMIGMEQLKKDIVNQILFFTQDLQENEMMHTIISGKAGSGKTSVATILGNIYKDLGILKKGTFTKAGRDDFIGEYLGSTAIKTKKLLKSCIGGVLFIDEAYSLGNKEKRDSFSKEAIDTLNQFLSENTKNFICIIAGYEDTLKECFFAWNPGLERRFPWKFKLEKYSVEELMNILYFQIDENGWMVNMDDKEMLEIMEKNKSLFDFGGGDCLVYFEKCKICHGRRVFGKDPDEKYVLIKKDFEEGMKVFKEFKKSNKKNNEPPPFMYN